MRNAHYLKPVSGGHHPAAIVGAAVHGTLDSDGAWSARLAKCHNGTVGSADSVWGSERRTFWGYLASVIKDHPGAWLFLNSACETLTALGFWELLEECKWELCDYDERNGEENSSGRHKAWRGFAVLEDPPTIILARHATTGRTVKIVDVRNYGCGGWGSLYGAPIPQSDNTLAAQVKAGAVAEFARRLFGIVRAAGLGSVKTTAASQAMHAYRHRFLRSPVLVHDNLPALSLERAAMFAGRNECWRIGPAPRGVYHLDFNAHYPAVVLGAPMPARLKGFTLGCEPAPDKLMRDGWCVIAEVTLATDSPRFPVRVSRARHARPGVSGNGSPDTLRARDGDLVYPVGTFATALCGPELSLAYRHGCVKRVHACAWYEPSEMFTQWSSELAILEERAKLDGYRPMIEFVKRLRNSLFGKFGQWQWRWTDAPDAPAAAPFEVWYGPHPDGRGMVRHRSVGLLVQREEKTGESPESCPAISAWVYSLARVKLLEAIECADRDSVYYMDADSLWVNHDGFARLQAAGWLHQSLPGKLKLKSMHDAVTFHGLKQYTVDGKTVAAGIPHGVPGDQVHGWSYQAPEKLMPALIQGRAPAQRMVRHYFGPTGVYRHGVVTAGGFVLPYTFNEE